MLVDGSALIDLKVGGKTLPVIVKDRQLHPVRDEVIHIDLLEVRLDEKIQTQVGVHIEGVEEAPGVKEGGVLEQVTHQLNIEALPTAIPDAIVVDVSGMEIAATMHLSELTAPEGVEFLDDLEETIIATVVVPTEVEEPEEIEEETELVGEDGEPIEAARRGGRGRVRGRRQRKPKARSPEPLPSRERRGRQGWTGWWSGSGTRATATPAPATTSASRWPRWPPSAGACRGRRSATAGLYTDGRTGPGGPRVGVLLPQTYMNDSGKSVSPARGELGVDLDHVVVVHDEIDLPFGRIEARLGGGLAGHNGLKARQARPRQPRLPAHPGAGVGRPDSTDPEIVSAHVLGRFSEPKDEVRELVERAADELDRLVARLRAQNGVSKLSR